MRRAARPSIAGAIAIALATIALRGTPAWGADRLAVVVVVPGDEALSDQLTEVAIAALAARSARDLIGLPELRPRLTEIDPAGDLTRCLSAAPCLSRLGLVADASIAVAGVARKDKDGAGLSLRLATIELAGGGVVATSAPIVAADAAGLIAGVRVEAARLMLALPAPRPPQLLAGPGAPSPHPGDRGARPAATWLAYGAAALAATAFTAAIVTGVVARGEPEGIDRADAQQDLARREGYATAANWSWVAGGVCAAGALAAYTWRLRLP